MLGGKPEFSRPEFGLLAEIMSFKLSSTKIFFSRRRRARGDANYETKIRAEIPVPRPIKGVQLR